MFQRVLNKSSLIICITHNSSNSSLYEISFTPWIELLPGVKSLTKVSLQSSWNKIFNWHGQIILETRYSISKLIVLLMKPGTLLKVTLLQGCFLRFLVYFFSFSWNITWNITWNINSSIMHLPGEHIASKWEIIPPHSFQKSLLSQNSPLRPYSTTRDPHVTSDKI